MTPEGLRAKHQPYPPARPPLAGGMKNCRGCSEGRGRAGGLSWPCEVVQALDLLDVANAEVERLKSELDSSTIRLAFRSGDLAHAKEEVQGLKGIIEEARGKLEEGNITAGDLRGNLQAILSRVSQVEEGT